MPARHGEFTDPLKPPTGVPFRKSAAYYDEIYRVILAARGTSVTAEADIIQRLIQAHKRSDGARLFDVACGAGALLEPLKQHYEVEGLDNSPEMLEIARRRHPDVVLHQAEMVDFSLGSTLDAIVCFGSSIGYVKTIDNLKCTLRTFAQHTVPGGVVIVQAWIIPVEWRLGHLTADLVDESELKIARVLHSDRVDDVSILDIHHLVATSAGVEYFESSTSLSGTKWACSRIRNTARRSSKRVYRSATTPQMLEGQAPLDQRLRRALSQHGPG